MKVYEKLVIDMTTGEVLEEVSYDYEGPVAACKGGGDAEVKETEDEKVLAQVGKQQWERYKDVFAPLENQYMDRVRMGEPERAQAEGVANAAVQQNYSGQPDQITGQSIERGAGMEGAGVSALQSSALDRAATQAMTGVNAQQNVSDAHYEGLESVIQLGRGKSASAVQGMSNIAARSNQEAVNSALQDFERRRSNVNAAAWGAGNITSAMMSAGGEPGYNSPATRRSPSVINDPGARDYHQGGGYRGSGF
ncbi:hypothetical protein [Arhodomonas sp. SL1]|uniref:hypothetical protein n=1 Tax=Arhodomonas sp. SL1 TaxID=3425691 RepID=UPI003F883920